MLFHRAGASMMRCRGGDSQARRSTCARNRLPLKRYRPPNCHCEERSDVAISQYTVGSWGSLRRNRNCLPEIATAPLGPRNDKLGGVCHFDGGLYGLQVHRREGHAPPLQRTAGGLRIFHSSFFSLQDSFPCAPPLQCTAESLVQLSTFHSRLSTSIPLFLYI